MRLSLVAAVTLALAAPSAHAATLAENMPAGALLTFETRNASQAIGRFAGVLRGALGGGDEGPGEVLSGFQVLLESSIGQEAAVGVFSVGREGRAFSPHLLAVSRVDEVSAEFFASLVPRRPGARIGTYTFVRSGSAFVGQSNGLVYVSTSKTLLMNHLARLNGKAAPRLLNSGAYALPARSVGAQEMSFFLNLSGMAKVIRSALAQSGLPRLLSPVVDALDTLGQYRAGFLTTDAGLNAASAHVPNAQGKDRPLGRLLTHTTTFGVQDILPANVESASARACHPESGAYLGRWLTRIDLLDPVGFLTDSQLASHLERSARYLGDECAQVTLAGGLKASLNTSDPLASLRTSVSYQRVRDQVAAEAHLPEYAASVNEAIAGVTRSLEGWLGEEDMGDLTDALPEGLGAAGQALSGTLEELNDVLRGLKMVYGFRDGYLVTAFSDEALRAALAEAPETLGASADFRAANLNLTDVAGWQYAPDLPDLSGEEVLGALGSDLMSEGLLEDDSAGIFATISEVLADVINRYDGMTAGQDVEGGVVVGRASVQYEW